MREPEDRSAVASGSSWVHFDIEGRDFKDEQGEWDRAIEATYVVPDRVRWSREVDGQLRVTADFTVHEGRVVCTSVTHHGSPERPVNVSAIRDVSLDEVGRAAVIEQAMTEHQGRPPTPEETASGNESAAFFHTERRPVTTKQVEPLRSKLRGAVGRPPTSRGELEQAAAIYRAAPTKPVQRVAEVMGLTPAQATRRVYLARKAGLLPPTTPGKAKG